MPRPDTIAGEPGRELSGETDIGLGDGTLRRFGAGDVLLAEI